MARKRSAGLLPFRRMDPIEVFLVHPGGPYWRSRDEGAWSIVKGEIDEDEDPLEAARREFREETGLEVAGEPFGLDPIEQKGGKTVYAWAVEADLDPADLSSNTFEIEWPPRSGRTERFPEVDRAAWLTLEDARRKILESQLPLLDQLTERI